jgi:hypothetical protein
VQAVIDAEDALRAEQSTTPLARAALQVIDLRDQLAELGERIREIGKYQTAALMTERAGLVVRQSEIKEKLNPTTSWHLPLLIAAVALLALMFLVPAVGSRWG